MLIFKKEAMNFTVYSKPNCPQCVQVKNKITATNNTYDEIQLDVGQEKESGKSYITRELLFQVFPDAKAMPLISFEKDGTILKIYSMTELLKHL